jgi:hypothetical protein
VEFFVHGQDESVRKDKVNRFCHSLSSFLEKGGFESRLDDIQFGQL